MSRTSRVEWAKRVERWKESGLSAKEFAAETGVKASTLSYWSWKLGARSGVQGDQADTRSNTDEQKRRRVEGPAVAAPRFVEVSASAVTTAPSTLELVLSGGVRVRVAAGFDEATLTRVVRAVEASR